MADIDWARFVKAVRLLVPIFALAVIAMGPFLDFAYGSICTISLGPLTIACPLGYVQTALASRSVALGLLIPATVASVGAALIGRAFCGWICPAGDAIQRLGDSGISLNVLSPRLTDFARQNSTRIVLFGSILAASAILQYPVFCVVCPVGVICRNVISLSQYGSAGLDLLLIPVFLALELGLAPWCAYICPLGTTLSLLSRKNPVHPVIEKVKCISCSICTKVCSMRVTLPKNQNVEDCSKCLECSLRCPTKAIKWRRNA